MKNLFVSLITFLFLHSLSYSATDSLLAYWSFDDGTARDVTGNGYDGMKMNNPTVVPGVAGNALHFQGKGYYMLANDDPANIGDHILLPPIDLTRLSEFSITLWVYHEGFSHYHGNSYFWFGNCQYGYLGIINTPFLGTSDPNYYIQFSVGGVYFNQNIIYTRFTNDMKKSWVCYALVYKDKILSAYVNGNLIGSMRMDVNYYFSNFAIARIWWLWDGEERTSARFTGAIDEVKIFKKALTEDEVKNECLLCGPMSFAYTDLQAAPSLRLLNNARIYNNAIRLTSASINQVGAVWTKHLVPVALGFETTFRFRVTEGNNPEHREQHFQGADGIAFVIQNSSSFVIGTLGGGIGYDGIPNSVAIEFDTYANDSTQIENFNDPNDNHIAVLANGVNLNSSKHTFPYVRGQTTNILPIRTDGTIYHAKIKYDNFNKRLSVWLDTTENFTNPSLEIEGFDLASELNLDAGEGAFIGFTSATGNAYENHDILAWSFCPSSRKIYLGVQEENQTEFNTLCNPLDNPYIILSSNKTGEVKIYVYNLLGNLIFVQQKNVFIGNNKIFISVDNHISGIYFCVITLKDEIILRRKLILIK